LEIQHLLSLLAEQLKTQTPLDWTITVTALIYIFLAARENAWCWVWGIVSCSLWAYADFARYNLWVDGILQIFYVGMAVWGIYAWKFGGGQKTASHEISDQPEKDQTGLNISVLPLKSHLLIFAGGALLTLVLGFIFKKYTPTALPYPDSFVTAFSIIATLLTVKKILENWLYWMVVDALAVFLFAARDAVLVAFVMAIYTVISIFGYLHWRKRWKR
jgi:nicotinamide mononucleotide transporter